MFRISVTTIAAVMLLACSGEPEPSPDAGMPVDAGTSLDAGNDATDAGSDSHDAGTGQSDAGTDPRCDGECPETTLEVTLDGKSAKFDRVQFGYTSPAKSSSGDWELHIEAYAGGDPACPTESSRTPNQALIIGAVPVPEDETPLTRADHGVSVVLFDFAEALTEAPVVHGAPVTLTPGKRSLCPECATDGTGNEGDYLTFELFAAMPGGLVSGQGFAEHCATMDDL